MATGRVPTTANSPLTAKGDLFTYSTAPARLAVGNNGETIVADSSTSTGLRWQVPVNANPVLNSSFQIWQRGTSFTYGGGGIAYQSDRWQGWGTGGGTAYTVTRQATGDTTNLPNIQYCLRMQRPAGNTNTDFWALLQSIETVNSIPYAGKTVTLSFYARKGANFSGASSALSALLYSGTGTDQNLSSGFTGSAVPINSTATLTTTWQRFSYTGTVSSTATQLGMNFNFQGTGTAGAADYFEITGVQIEVGSVATPFKTYAGTIQGELAAAQRYYYRNTGVLYYAHCLGNIYSTTIGSFFIQPPIQMRVAPTAVEFSNLAIGEQGNLFAVTNITIGHAAPNGIQFDATSSGLTANRWAFLQNNNNTAGYLAFTAEL
jgi:hypothetical protein